MNKYKVLLILFFFFNLIDTITTLYFIHVKGAQELNPVMKTIMDISPGLFVAVKLYIGSMATILMWEGIDSKWAKIATIFTFTIYAMLMIYDSIIITLHYFGVI